jgi:hypothetical protein
MHICYCYDNEDYSLYCYEFTRRDFSLEILAIIIEITPFTNCFVFFYGWMKGSYDQKFAGCVNEAIDRYSLYLCYY